MSAFVYIHYFFFWLCLAACGILVPWPGIIPAPPAVEARSPNHWTTREVPTSTLLTFETVLVGGARKLSYIPCSLNFLKTTQDPFLRHRVQLYFVVGKMEIYSSNNWMLTEHPLWAGTVQDAGGTHGNQDRCRAHSGALASYCGCTQPMAHGLNPTHLLFLYGPQAPNGFKGF